MHKWSLSNRGIHNVAGDRVLGGFAERTTWLEVGSMFLTIWCHRIFVVLSFAGRLPRAAGANQPTARICGTYMEILQHTTQNDFQCCAAVAVLWVVGLFLV